MSGLFNLGRTVITPGALDKTTPEEQQAAITRHVTGAWAPRFPGDEGLCSEDVASNLRAVAEKSMILSTHRSASGAKFYVITDPGHTVTTILLPSEY